MSTTTYPSPQRGRCATSLRIIGPSLVAQPTEGNDPMNLRHLAAAAALTIGCTTPMSAAAADSRASRGMGRGPGPCMAVATAEERALMRHESNGWPTARNPTSSAFGCGQLLASMRRAHYPKGCPVATTNVACQMAGFRHYYRSRYGTAERALAARRRKGWY